LLPAEQQIDLLENIIFTIYVNVPESDRRIYKLEVVLARSSRSWLELPVDWLAIGAIIDSLCR
jgi:hypothetical protein